MGPPTPSCISPEVVRQLACPADQPAPVFAVPPVTWPSGDHLFHWGADTPWTRPLDPRALQAAVGRTSQASAASPAVMSKLNAADRAFDAAAAPGGQADEIKTQQARWKAAADGYAGALRVAGAGHRLRGYMLHRHIRALWNAGQPDDALAELVALFQHLKATSDRPGAKALSEIARADLPLLYADSSRKPADAASWLAGVTRSASEATVLCEAIAEAYLARAKYDAARTVLAELQAAHSGASACVYAARQLAVSITQTPFDERGLAKLVDEQLARRQRVEQSPAAAADKESCRAATLAPMVELASAWQTDAVGWNGVLGSSDPRRLTSLAKLYRALFEQFTAEEFRATPLRAVPAPNLPSRERAGFAHAQLERWRHRADRCRSSYEQLYDPSASVALRAAATEGAIVCHIEHLGMSPWSRFIDVHWKRKGDDLSDGLTKLPELLTRNLCLIEPATTDAVGLSQRIDVELLRGRIAFIERRWERAAAALQRLAYEPGHAQAREAAAMYLIALHQLGEGGSAVCGADLAGAKPRLAALHCSRPDRDAALVVLAVPGVTTRGTPSRLTPCEALRAVGAPPPPPPPPPKRDPPPTPRDIGGDRTTVAGAAIPQVVEWVLRLHEPQLRACYAAALRRDAFFEPHRGELRLRFTVGRDGSVSTATSSHRGFPNRVLTGCVIRALYGMEFAQPEGGIVSVEARAELSLARGLRLTSRPGIWQSID